MRYVAHLLAGIVILGGHIYSQQEPQEIIVTATRIPRPLKYLPSSASTVTREEIESVNYEDLGDLIEDLAGLRVLRYGTVGASTSVHIRGLYSKHVLVLKDGRPLNSPSTGSADLSWLSDDDIERIEVVRGPGSAVYGADAVAGVVNIVTKKPPEKFSIKVSSSRGSRNTSIWRFENGATFGEFGYLVSATRRESEGERDNSFHESIDINLKGSYKFIKDAQILVGLGYHGANTGHPGVRPAEDITKRTSSQLTFGNDEVSSLFDKGRKNRIYVDLGFKLGGIRFLGFFNNWDDKDHRRWIEYAQDILADDVYRTKFHGMEFYYTGELLKGNMLNIGASYRRDGFDVNGKQTNLTTGSIKYLDWDAKRTTRSIFFENELESGPIIVKLGARYDNPSDYPSRITPRAGIVWNFHPQRRLKLSYGESFRAPSLNDLYWPEDPYARGNKDLDPERGRTYEIGLEGDLTENFSGRIWLFREDLKDMIAWAPTGPPGAFGNLWQPTNLNRAKINGLELELQARIFEDLKGNLCFTYLDAKQENMELIDAITSTMEKRTRRLAYAPRRKIDLGIEYKRMFGHEGLRINLDLIYVSEVYQYYQNWSNYPAVSMDTKKLKGFVVVNLKLRERYKSGEFFISLENIFDREYSTQFGNDIYDRDYPAPGRSLTAGVSFRF